MRWVRLKVEASSTRLTLNLTWRNGFVIEVAITFGNTPSTASNGSGRQKKP